MRRGRLAWLRPASAHAAAQLPRRSVRPRSLTASSSRTRIDICPAPARQARQPRTTRPAGRRHDEPAVRRGHDREPTAGPADRAVGCVRLPGGVTSLNVSIEPVAATRLSRAARHGQWLPVRVSDQSGSRCRSAPRLADPRPPGTGRPRRRPDRARVGRHLARAADRIGRPARDLPLERDRARGVCADRTDRGLFGFVASAPRSSCCRGRCRRLVVGAGRSDGNGRSPSRRLDRGHEATPGHPRRGGPR